MRIVFKIQGGKEMFLTLTIIHVIISVILIVVVLMQHGKQQGLSGAIAGGAETFFGKNKGRTIDAMLKKFTAVIAILFVISSLALTAVAVKDAKSAAETETAQEQTADTEGQQDAAYSLDENGNMVDAEGNIVATADELAEAQAAQEAENAENTENAEETENAEGNENAEATPAE